jgi:XXXCH domain-containing protein
MKFEEKKAMKRDEITALLKGFGDLIEGGKLSVGDRTVHFPETARVEVEYKETKTYAKLEIEVKWNVTDDKTKDESIEGVGVGLKEVKNSIKESFNSIRKTVESGNLPSQDDLDGLIGFNNDFDILSRGRAFEKEMDFYMELVRRLYDAFAGANLEEMGDIIESLRSAKKGCHKKYRWKEG